MSMDTKNILVSLIVGVLFVGIIVFVMRGRGNNDNNDNKPTTTTELFSVENFPQSAPMNVMYSDSNGNLGTTTDLGIQYLTVNGDSMVTGNSAVTGNMTTNGNSVVNGNSTVKGDSNLNGNVLSRDVFGGGSQVKTEMITAGPAYGGRLHLLGDNVYVMAKNGVRIATDPNSKNPWGASNGNLTVDGGATIGSNINVNGKVLEKGNELVASGMIVMWGGAVDKIPAGWVLCDGVNGTPNLRGLFIVGAGPGSYSVGATGGANEVRLSIDQMPRHSHRSNNTSNKIAGDGWGTKFAGGGSNGIDTNGNITTFNALITDQGGDQPHENRPPYYALCYIMKV